MLLVKIEGYAPVITKTQKGSYKAVFLTTDASTITVFSKDKEAIDQLSEAGEHYLQLEADVAFLPKLTPKPEI